MENLGATPASLPERKPLTGDRLTLVPLDAEQHAAPLFAAMHDHAELWLYMFDRPPVDEESYRQNLAAKAAKTDPFFYTILDNTSKPVGIASYLRIEPAHRVIEVGNIMYSPRLQRTAAATETMYLMAKHAFEDLGYRRYEWKCNALNQPSRRAALRLGFTFEGIFRQHMIIKGENRDTAWFAMLDSEWPAIKSAFEKWLEPSNFDSDGKQKFSLIALRSG
jgi:RimJ/RimL family protein N-acetyltransferase